MPTLNFPQGLYFDRGVENDIPYRRLYIYYKEKATDPIKEAQYEVKVNERITLSVSEDHASITIEENSSPISNKKVEAKIDFERSTSPESGLGTIEGGFFINKDSTKDSTSDACVCATYIRSYRDQNGSHDFPITIEHPNKFMLAIIGVDDIRAKTDNTYLQPYRLEEQQLSFMLEYIGVGPDTRIMIEYGPQ